MIRTLRITSIVAGLLAVALLAFFSASGVKGDTEVERLLQSPTILEQVAKDKVKPSTASINPMSRLVDLAQGFANMMNPPPPSPRLAGSTESTGADDALTVRPIRVSAKFKLLATSYNGTDPNLSLAFVEMPTVDRRQYWARVGNFIEHWKILEIKDGAIVYGDGQQSQEIPVEERPARVSLLDTGEPRPAAVPGAAGTSSTATDAFRSLVGSGRPSLAKSRVTTKPSRRSDGVAARPPQDELNVQEMEKIVDRLRTLQKDANDSALSPEQDKVRRDAMELLVTRMKAARMSQQEANSLGELGQHLDTIQPEADINNPQ